MSSYVIAEKSNRIRKRGKSMHRQSIYRIARFDAVVRLVDVVLYDRLAHGELTDVRI